MIKMEDIDSLLKKYGYFAEEELQYQAFLGLLNFNRNTVNVGQDIYTICLEGPPGAGKTEYANTYAKLITDIYKGNCVLIEYQCDATTGKNELFEDVNMTAAIKRDADNVNIPGKLVEAIHTVNEGKKVILFLDEYDKAREETDAFLLQFLQSGKINTVQYGDLAVKEEYKSNLQVILCKNDMRETLSGPLSRRIRIVRLDYMKPSIFYKVAVSKLLSKEIIDEGLLNLVCILYQKAYENRDLLMRLPSCSEMLIAIQDASQLLKMANAPKNILYKTIISNMFKSEDDIRTFESIIAAEKDEKFKDLIESMTKKDEVDSSILDIICKTVLESRLTVLTKDLELKIEEQNKAREEYITKIAELRSFLEEQRNIFATLEQEKNQIESQNKQKAIHFADGEIMPISEAPSTSLFNDVTKNIKRGTSVFDDSTDWTKIATAELEKSDNEKDILDLINHIQDKFVVYEDGFLISRISPFKLVAIRRIENEKTYFDFYANTPFVPSVLFLKLADFIDEISKWNEDCPIATKIQCLVYAQKEIHTDYLDPLEIPNTYVWEGNFHLSYLKNVIQDLSYNNVIEDEPKMVTDIHQLTNMPDFQEKSKVKEILYDRTLPF